jgi:arginase
MSPAPPNSAPPHPAPPAALLPATGTRPRRVRILGAAAALGAPHPGAAAAPDALQAGALVARCARRGLVLDWAATLRPDSSPSAQAAMAVRLAACTGFDRELAEHLAGLAPEVVPLVLGGDHAIAVGTWRGLARRAACAPGLIWIDAHLDSHTPVSTHSGNIHGMPLAALLGEGDAGLCAIAGPTLDPSRCCVIGAHAWEDEERTLLDRLQVRIFTRDEIRRRGLSPVFAEALQIVRGTDPAAHAFGLSLDLDVLDPLLLPAVTCPEAGGLGIAELVDALQQLRPCDTLIGMEIVEYRPDLDPAGEGMELIAALAAAALGRA